jgi:hypothetical protein
MFEQWLACIDQHKPPSYQPADLARHLEQNNVVPANLYGVKAEALAYLFMHWLKKYYAEKGEL